jgi:putative FmdB family regulatory protein
MPLFEYTCQACEHTFEELVQGGERVECPECHGDKVEKLLSVPALTRTSDSALPMSGCGDPSLPPCGAPWCQRKGST